MSIPPGYGGGMGQAKTNSATPALLKRVTLEGVVRAAYEWFRYPPSSFRAAAANIDEAVRDTFKSGIRWVKRSDTLYEGYQSSEGANCGGRARNYRLEVEPEGRLSYRNSNLVYGGGMYAHVGPVNVNKSPLNDPVEDRAIQDRLSVLSGLVEKAIATPQTQTVGVY
jgi:hypothetical protein